MRPHLPRPLAAHQPAASTGQAGSEVSLAETFLGGSHPLVGVLRQSEAALEQLVSVSVVQAGAVVFWARGLAVGLSLVIAAAICQVALLCRVAALSARRHDLCLELVVEGGARLPLPCLKRLRRRLLDRRRLDQLARSVDELVDEAARRVILPGAPRPLAHPRVIRAAAPLLRQLASLLREDSPDVRGVAMVEWLLTSPATPLYGTEVEPLRRELGRARYLLGLEPFAAGRAD
jgi:hypothetical protein